VKCRRHCWVWTPAGMGYFAVACAHCDACRRTWLPVDPAGDADRAAHSAAAHAAAGCVRPARLPALVLLGA
jgi:hypothetical protein